MTERLKNDERVFFHAVATDSDAPVCLLELRPDEAPGLAAAAKVRHAHLADVREVLEHEGVSLLAFERVPGTTLTERLRDIGKKSQVDAVGSALRVSDALSNLHERGGVHGFIHTDSVVLDPPERLGPVLTFAPVPSDERTFHSPERGESGKPSVEDDAWAVAGLLHMMLTSAPPPKDGYADEDALAEAGVEDPALRAALLHGLHSDVDARSSDVRPLKRELARWFVEHAGEEPVLVGPHSTQPPPLPASISGSAMPARVVGSTRVPRRRRKPPFAVIAVVGTLVGLGAAWAYSAYRKPNVQLVERQAEPAAIATAKAIDLSEVPVTGEEQNVELDKASSCVGSYLPKNAFAKSPDLGWLCEEADAMKGGQKLRVAVVTGAPKGGGPTDAMKIFARLGWYEAAAYAVVRAGCCEDPKPLGTRTFGEGCEALSEPLRALGKQVVAGEGYDEALSRYAAAVECEVARGNGASLSSAQRPKPSEPQAFRELLDAIRH